MKCDKLSVYCKTTCTPNGLYYDKPEADTAIAELKAENERLKEKLMLCLNGDCILTCEVVEKYGKENAELKQKLAEQESETRRLKRALWLARAQRANEHYHRYHGKFLCPLEDIPEYVKWKQVERKCRAKADEFGG